MRRILRNLRLFGVDKLWAGGIALLVLIASGAHGAVFRPGAIVLEFQNLSAYQGHLLGRRAADQLAVELGATGAWRIIDRAQTRRAMQQRGLQAPYAVGLMQELAHALGAEMIFTGAIQKLAINPKTGSVRLTILVEAFDQISGQSALATVQTAEAVRQEKKPQPTDVLVDDALASALAVAAKVASANAGKIMTVTDPGDGKTVCLSKPAQERLQPGGRLLLYRPIIEGEERMPGKLIALLLLTECGPDGCQARVLARAGDIHTDDIAVSICSPPSEK